MVIQNHTFLVTGGAAGLGAACARMITQGGGNAVIADVNATVGEALANELGAQARFVPTDVTDERSVQRAIEIATTTFGALQGAINCAGIAIAELLLRKGQPHMLSSFANVISVNLIGTFNASRLAAAAMATNEPNAEGERGVIINTASVAAFEGQIGQVAYSASKGGVAAMTLPLARELSRYENAMLNGEVIRLDGAIRMAPK